MKKIIVTGCNGQLGRAINLELAGNPELEFVNTDVNELDITNIDEVLKLAREVKPYAIINCAAHTAVDACETDVDNAYRINAIGPRNLSIAATQTGAKMVHISTDYVFNGEGERPWEPEDACAPTSVYGQTKYEGELAVQELLDKYFIVRIAWVFGINGKNFVKTMLNLSKTHDTLKVVNDQFGSPTYTYDLARLLVDMVQTDKYGIYHATNEGICSWYEFACAIFKEAGIDMKVLPVSSEEYGAKAKRPANSRMSKEKLTENGFDRLPAWQDALKRYIAVLKEEK